MARLLKRDYKSVGIVKNTMTDLVGRLQPVVTILKKSTGNWPNTLLVIKQYWGQGLYDWFANIDKVLGSNKFFCHLGTVVQ